MFSGGVWGLYDLLKRAGVASLDGPADHYGLALVLGGGDLTLLELAELYGMLARQGTRVPTRTMMDGRAGAHRRDTWHGQHGSGGAEGAPDEGQRILSRESAYLTLQVLTGVPLEDQKIALNASVSRGSHELYWFLDGALIWKGEPGKTAFLDPVPGVHRLTAKDDAGRSAAVTVMIEGGGFCALP